MGLLTIGKVARIVGVNIETIRYYERLGILPKPKRRESIWGHGYRQYTHDDVNRLLFIREAKRLGFSLREIHELLSIGCNGNVDCDAVRKKAEEKVFEIEQKIKSLRMIKKTLDKLIKACATRRTIEGCPILNTIGRKDVRRKGGRDEARL